MSNLGFHCHRISHLEKGILANDLKRGEFYNFPAEELPALKQEIRRYNLAVSIHTPLVRPEWYPDPPTWTFLCDVNREKRELSLRMIQETLEQAGEYDAEYVVVHFPSPAHEATEVSYPELREIALESCYHLDKLSERYKVAIHLEGFGPSPFLTTDFLTEVLSQFTAFRYCFDTGHMNLTAQRSGFDLYAFGSELPRYIGSIHLWNTRGIDDYLAFGHIPVHPSQEPEQGWVDIARVLRVLGLLSQPIIFESAHHYPEMLGNYDYRDGVKWVKQLVATLS